jgi:hypothetical protein
MPKKGITGHDEWVLPSISVGKPTVGTCVRSTKAGQQHCSLRASVPFGNSSLVRGISGMAAVQVQ